MKFFGPVLSLVLLAPLSGAIAASQKAVTVDIPAGTYAGQSSGPAIIMNASWVYGDGYPDYPWGDYSWKAPINTASTRSGMGRLWPDLRKG